MVSKSSDIFEPIHAHPQLHDDVLFLQSGADYVSKIFTHRSGKLSSMNIDRHGDLLAIIPARGGSKRIPRKNIRPFLGVPLLTRTIGIVLEAAIFDRVVVSTEDSEIADIALAAGAEVPFRRPVELAEDDTATVPVVSDAIRQLRALGYSYQATCCVYPAAVLSLPADYRDAIALLRRTGADYVFAAGKFGYPIQRALRINIDGGVEMYHPEHLMTRSQDLEPAFHDAGQFYVGTEDAWLNERAIFSSRARMQLLPANRVQDIDTIEDWAVAEALFSTLKDSHE